MRSWPTASHRRWTTSERWPPDWGGSYRAANEVPGPRVPGQNPSVPQAPRT